MEQFRAENKKQIQKLKSMEAEYKLKCQGGAATTAECVELEQQIEKQKRLLRERASALLAPLLSRRPPR